MCDLVTAMMIGSTVVSGAGQIAAGKAQASAANYNAKVAEMNATLADRRARDAIERGKLEEQRKRMEVSQLQGAQRAAMAANGVDLSFGSPLDALVDTAMMGELDALTIRANASREAYDQDVQGVNLRADAALSRANAKSAKAGGFMGAMGTVLGGGADVYKYRSSLRA